MVTHDHDLASRCKRMIRLGDGKGIEEQQLSQEIPVPVGAEPL